MLYEFYGATCSHCKTMMPMVDALIAEGFDIKKLEVWNDEANAKVFAEKNKDRCPGVPFFLNEESGQWICGETDEETLRKWVKGLAV